MAGLKTVCIVGGQVVSLTNICMLILFTGAGPAGLVAAKTLLHAYPDTFAVTIFERQKSIGGLWPTEPDRHEGLLSPEMPTNLSKYTVSFSDLAWASVDLSARSTSSLNSGVEPSEPGRPDATPMFPKAWHAGRYLETYAQRYLRKASILTNCTVESAVREGCGGGHRWKVNWTRPAVDLHNGVGSIVPDNDLRADNSAKISGDEFDYLVVASGFFGTPKLSPLLGLETFPGVIMHSTKLRDIDGLRKSRPMSEGTYNAMGTNGDQGTGKVRKIVVVGGGMSGAEAAASLALQVSTQRHSPRRDMDDGTEYQIYHVTARPFYAVPTYVPIDPLQDTDTTPEGASPAHWNEAPCFAQIDLCLYNLTRRRPGLISDHTGALTAAQSRATHDYLCGLVGGHQEDVGSEALHVTSQYQDKPPRVVICDGYPAFVRSGAIMPVLGRVVSLGVSGSGEGSVKVSCAGDERILEDVAAVIMATGFSPQASLNWLPKDVLATLQHDGNNNRMPLILQHGSYCHSELPNLGFIGFYEGPYWGIMEMQAHLLVGKWTNDINDDTSKAPTNPHAEEIERQQMLAMRTALEHEPESFSQFWMGDYVGFMETFARDLLITRTELDGFDGRAGPSVPARYPHAGDHATEIIKSLVDLDGTLHKMATEAAFVANAAFRAMQGTWSVRRVLKSAIPTYPSGRFTGIAAFHPRRPTDKLYDAEYLYVEDGELVTDNSLTMRGSRRYVYRYQARSDVISAWFVKPDDGKSVDYFFHKLQFHVSNEGRRNPSAEEKGWSATGHHLCVVDDYNSSYLFQFHGAALRRFMIRYQVKGPKKDYSSETWYERPEHRATVDGV